MGKGIVLRATADAGERSLATRAWRDYGEYYCGSPFPRLKWSGMIDAALDTTDTKHASSCIVRLHAKQLAPRRHFSLAEVVPYTMLPLTR